MLHKLQLLSFLWLWFSAFEYLCLTLLVVVFPKLLVIEYNGFMQYLSTRLRYLLLGWKCFWRNQKNNLAFGVETRILKKGLC